MYREDLEEELQDLLGDDFIIKTDSKGKIVIHTKMVELPDGKLVHESELNSTDSDDEYIQSFEDDENDDDDDENEVEEED